MLVQMCCASNLISVTDPSQCWQVQDVEHLLKGCEASACLAVSGAFKLLPSF